MPPDLLRLESGIGALPGLPAPADVADTWLAYALSQLFDAYRLPEATRRELAASGSLSGELVDPPQDAEEASRLAVEFAALAVEARLNLILETCGAGDWGAIAHLAPVEKYRIAPRLLGHPEGVAQHLALNDGVAELYALRDELVGAGSTAALDTQSFSPGTARRVVEAAATVCAFLSTLAGRDDGGVAEHVRRAAHALDRHPARIAASDDWNDFPPDVIGS